MTESRPDMIPPRRRKGGGGDRPQIFGKTLFVDLMMSTLVVVTALLMASKQVDKEEEQKKQTHLATDGLYAIVLTWPDGSNDDVDLYVKSPLDKVVFFQNKGAEVDLMHLENDDLGSRRETVNTAGGALKVVQNEERVIIQGAIPGEYVVNAQMYAKHDPGPTPIKVSLYALRGSDTELKVAERTLNQSGDEVTAFRFTLDADGEVTGYSDLPISLVGIVSPQAQNGATPGGL